MNFKINIHDKVLKYNQSEDDYSCHDRIYPHKIKKEIV